MTTYAEKLARLLVAFNKAIQPHGVVAGVEEKLKAFISHVVKSCKNELCIVAWLITYILQEHPFIDGNKRTALFLLDLYLDRKGYMLDNSSKLQILFKLVSPDYTPRKAYQLLKKLLELYNPHFKP